MSEEISAVDMATVLGAILNQEGVIALHMSAFEGLADKQITITPIEDDDVLIIQLEDNNGFN